MKFFFSLILLLTTLTGTPAFDPIDGGDCGAWDTRTCPIKKAVDEYLDNATKTATVDKYGLIEDWNTSLVTDMSSLFDGDKIVGSETQKCFLSHTMFLLSHLFSQCFTGPLPSTNP